MYPQRAVPTRPRVLLIGAGALGCAAARTLAASGVADLTLVDDDCVESSNLQRQVLYDEGDLGSRKVEAAARSLRAQFAVSATALPLRATQANVDELIADADVVVDACDDPDTKFLLNRACVASSTPLVYGGVARTGGQWMLIEPGRSCCLACIFPERGDETAQGCSAMGILAPVAGLIGTMQAVAALRLLLAPSRVRSGRLFLYELCGRRMRHIDFAPSDRCACRSQSHAERSSLRQTWKPIVPQSERRHAS